MKENEDKEYNKLQLLKEIEITGISHQGKGIGRIDGKVVFAAGALPGEVVEVKITKQKKSFAEGIVTRVLSPSNNRIQADCEVSTSCGGCVFRHATYQEEVNLKTRIVKETLNKIAGVDPELVSDCIPSPINEHYRNKLQYHVQIIEGKPNLGFMGIDNKFFSSKNCLLADKNITAWAEVIEQYLPNNVSRIIIRRSFPEGKLMCLLLSKEKIKLATESVNEIMSFPNAASVYGNLTHPSSPDIIGTSTYKICGEDYLIEENMGVCLAVGPTSFFQVNPYQTSSLYTKAIDFLSEDDNLLDLYCGVGSITLAAAGKVNSAVGIEISQEAISYAKLNAKLNNIENTRFFAGDVAELIDRFGIFSSIILNPPRKGCEEKVLLHIAEKTHKIIYVSCESSTLARDVKILKSKGFEVKEVIPVDMFPRTWHVETVVLMSRVDK